EVVAAAGPGGHVDLRQRRRLVLPAREELVARDRAFFQVEDVADRLPPVLARAQAAHLEDELRLTEIHDGDLRVRRLSLVAVAEATAQAHHAPGQRGVANAPAREVH